MNSTLTGVEFVRVIQCSVLVHAPEDVEVGPAHQTAVAGPGRGVHLPPLDVDPRALRQVQHMQVVVERGPRHPAVHKHPVADGNHHVTVARFGRVPAHADHCP